MKKIIVAAARVFAAVLLMALGAAACASAPGSSFPGDSAPGDSAPGDSGTRLPDGYARRKLSASVPLAAKQTKGTARIVITLALLEASEASREGEFFREAFYLGNSAEQYRDALVRKYRTGYQEPPPGAGSAADWEYWERMEARGLRDRGLVLERERYVYTGGAHGLQTKTYYVIDREELRILGLADFFREPDGAELRRLVLEELRRYGGLETGQPLSAGIFFENEPAMSANFHINSEGLGLRWDPYEIAPYSEGGIEIILPWRAIRPLLKLEAMELLATFGIYLFVV